MRLTDLPLFILAAICAYCCDYNDWLQLIYVGDTRLLQQLYRGALVSAHVPQPAQKYLNLLLKVGAKSLIHLDCTCNDDEFARLCSVLTAIQRLDIVCGPLTVLPPEIRNLTTLRHLGISGNRLTRLSPNVEGLTALQALYLNVNDLASIPSELGNLTSLQRLNVAHNKLTAIPPELGQLVNLRELALHGNKLTAVPSELGNLTDLRELAMAIA